MNTQLNALRAAIATACAVGLLAGCSGGSGDIELSADDNSVVNDNSTDGSSDSSDNPCATYTDAATDTVLRGSFDGENCSYSSDFVGENNPLTVDLTIPFITGVHIFEDSLFVGENTDGTTGPAPAAGEGPTLTIRAGATLAWTQSDDYLLVNRGSSIVAEGSRNAPITLTGFTDAVSDSAGQYETQLWGGLVINGNGITNKCSDAQRAEGTCHVLAEGKPSNYGGNANDESSGTLQYVVVKHPGFEVAPGSELNGITFNAVGSGTVVENVQVYATYDDGVEFFGGAVEVDNLVALYVQDDSIDWADGFAGAINNALIIHAPGNGNRCIEADNQSGAPGAQPVSSAIVRNMTCITSAAPEGEATHGDAEGVLFRVGTEFQLVDSIIYDGYARTLNSRTGNECFEIEDAETLALAEAGASSLQNVLIACEEPTKGTLANGDTVDQWVLNAGAVDYADNTGNVIIADSANPSLSVLDGFYTAATVTDETGTEISFMDGDGNPVRIGAVSADDDWTANWTFGLDTLWISPAAI